MNITAIVVYGPFGRVLRRFSIGPAETHHRASEEARLFLAEVRASGRRAWSKVV